MLTQGLITCIDKIEKDGYHALVCSVCGKILLHENDVNYLNLEVLKKNHHILTWEYHIGVHDCIHELEEKYKIHVDDVNGHIDYLTLLCALALSPC